MGWDDIFDFDGDGDTDLYEAVIGYKVIHDALDSLQDDTDSDDEDWRECCEDGSDYDLDPENFDSEIEYEMALEQAQEAWKEPYRSHPLLDVDPDFYDTEEEYLDAVEDAKDEWREECNDLFLEAITPDDFDTKEEFLFALEKAIQAAKQNGDIREQAGVTVHSEANEPPSKTLEPGKADTAPPSPAEPTILGSDARNAVLTLCGVLFDGSGHPYSYLTGGISVRVGDKVVVPVGEDGEETIAEVVWVAQCRQSYAPYPADHTKTVREIFTPPSDSIICPLLGREITPDECCQTAGTACTKPLLTTYSHSISGTAICKGYPQH